MTAALICRACNCIVDEFEGGEDETVDEEGYAAEIECPECGHVGLDLESDDEPY